MFYSINCFFKSSLEKKTLKKANPKYLKKNLIYL